MRRIVVIGGGWSGVSAAVCAKKAGAEVTLIEKTDLLLGAGNAGGIFRNNGRYTAIGISYAQDLPAAQTMELFANQASSRYKRAGAACRSLTVQTPYAKGAAEDTAVKNSHMSLTDCCLPVMNDIQAARWARGKLLSINRECESLEVQGDFSPGMSAMMRIDIDGDTDATGEWVVELAEHDLIAMKTAISLRRCVRTIR